jgi:hypothetical protein
VEWQRRHGRAGAGDVDAVQHQRHGAAAAADQIRRSGGLGRVAGLVLQAAGCRVGCVVRAGADARDGARRRAPSAALRAEALARNALPLPPGPGLAGLPLNLAQPPACPVNSKLEPHQVMQWRHQIREM